MKKKLLLASLVLPLGLAACFTDGDTGSASGTSISTTMKVLSIDETSKTIKTQEISSYCEDSVAVVDTSIDTQNWMIKDGYIALMDTTDIEDCHLALKTTSQSILGTHSATAPWVYRDAQGNACTPSEEMSQEGLTSIQAVVTSSQITQTITFDLSKMCMADNLIQGFSNSTSGTQATKVDCQTIKLSNPVLGEISIKSEFVGGSPYEAKTTITKGSKSCTSTIKTPKPGQIVDNAFCAANSGGAEGVQKCMMEVMGVNAATAKTASIQLQRAIR